MKNIPILNNLKNAILIFFISFGFASSYAATFDTDEKKQIETIIDDYVSNHPEVILRAMKKLEQDEKKNLEENMLKIASKIRKSDSIPFLGKKTASHYIIEFYDYNCGYCKVLEPMFERALKDYDVQISFVNIPVIKENSKQLALLGQAVFNIDSKKYFKLHEKFMTPGSISSDETSVRKYLDEVGIDFNDFKKELSSGRPQSQISSNIEDSIELKIAGTPYLIIDGKEVRGALTSYSALQELLK